MKKGKRGFTLIEVALFLAITGALFAGVTVGVQNSISQQRNNDSVQSFIEFLRSVYSEVENVQNIYGGRSERAIYGKLIVFGESKNLAGETVDGNTIFKYTVVGNVLQDSVTGKALEMLKDGRINANVAIAKTENEETKWEMAGIVESYVPKWAAEIEPYCTNEDRCYEPLKGMMLIVRHPRSGTIYTYYSDEMAEVNLAIKEGRNPLIYREGGLEKNYLDTFETNKEINFCINTSGEKNIFFRNGIRVAEGARNASGIKLISDEENGCIKR